MDPRIQPMIEKMREFLGTPFHHQGRVKGVGVDCAGLLIEGTKEAGLKGVPDLTGYRRSPDGSTLQQIMDDYLDRVPKGENWQVGDILLFQFDGVMPQHMGMVTQFDPPYMIHAYSVARKVVEHIVDDIWLKRLVRVYRIRPEE